MTPVVAPSELRGRKRCVFALPPRRSFAAWLATAALLGAPPARVSGGPTLLDQARDGNQAAIQSIQTFYCQVAITGTSLGAAPSVQGEYWRSPEAVRVRYSTQGKSVDAVAKDSLVRTIARDVTGRSVGSVVADRGRAIPDCNVWDQGLLAIPLLGETFDLQPFHRLLEHGQKVGKVARRPCDGGECIVVELIDPNIRREVWFDPRVNYLIRKYRVMQTEQRANPWAKATEIAVTRFVEVQPGCFFPEQVEMRSTVNGNEDDTRSTRFSDIRINEPLPADIFDFQIPSGTNVVDMIQGKSYITDSAGRPQGELKDFKLLTGPVIPASPGEVTHAESLSWYWWLFVASLAALGLAASLWARQKWLAVRLR